MDFHKIIVEFVILLASLSGQPYDITAAQVAGILGGRGGDSIAVSYIYDAGNGIDPDFDNTGISAVPFSWGDTSLAVAVGADNGTALRGRTYLNNRVGYVSRMYFMLVGSSMEPGTFVSVNVMKGISSLPFYDDNVPIGAYIKLANVDGTHKFQIVYPTNSGEATATWSGSVTPGAIYELYIEYNVVGQYLVFKVNSETVVQHTFDAAAVQSVGTLVIGSSGGSTGRNITYLIDRIIEHPLQHEGVGPSNVRVTVPASGATNVEVSTTLRCDGTQVDEWEIRYGTTSPITSDWIDLGNLSFHGPVSLLNNTQYFVECRGTNQNGSDTSDESSFTTKAASSTGTHPILFDIASREAEWAQMKADYDASPTCVAYAAGTAQKLSCDLYKKAVANSNLGPHIANNTQKVGLSELFLAMVPGNNATFYCDKVYTRAGQTGQFLTWPSSSHTGVFALHWMADFVLMYDVCYGEWTQARRDTWLTQLNKMAEYAANLPWDGSYSCPDVDIPTGHYAGIAALYEATKAYNPSIVTLWEKTPSSPPGGAPGGYTVGTLHCSALSGKTWRNMIDYYYRVAYDGGVSHEGSQYGFGLENGPFIGLWVVELLRGTDGDGQLAEVEAWGIEHSRWIAHAPTPDERDMAQWGDDQIPRKRLSTSDNRLAYDYIPLAMGMAGILSDGTERQALQRRILNLYGRYGSLAIPEREKQFLLYNPYDTAAADMSSLPSYLYAPGAGVTIWREGGSTNDCQFFTNFPPHLRPIDHVFEFFGDWQLYCNQEWSVTHPVGYAFGSASSLKDGQWGADLHNAMWIEGLATFPTLRHTGLQYRQINGHTVGSDYIYTAGTQGGSVFTAAPNGFDNSGYWDPPPRFVHEHSRTLLGLPSATKTYFSVLEINRVNALDPSTLEKYDRYTSLYTSNIAAEPRWTNFLHQLREPTVSSNVTTWSTTGGQQLRDVWLAPDAVTITKVDEDAIGATSLLGIGTVELAWRTKITPNSDTQWNCLSRIVTQRDSSSVTVESVTELSPTNNAAGVLLTRTGNDDRVAVWNCAQGASITQLYPTTAQAEAVLATARYRAAGSFTVEYTQTTDSAKVFLLDLNPALTWAYTLDGGASTPISEDSGGFEELTISGIGAHTLVVTGS